MPCSSLAAGRGWRTEWRPRWTLAPILPRCGHPLARTRALPEAPAARGARRAAPLGGPRGSAGTGRLSLAEGQLHNDQRDTRKRNANWQLGERPGGQQPSAGWQVAVDPQGRVASSKHAWVGPDGREGQGSAVTKGKKDAEWNDCSQEGASSGQRTVGGGESGTCRGGRAPAPAAASASDGNRPRGSRKPEISAGRRAAADRWDR